MKSSWYNKYLPTIKTARTHIPSLVKLLKKNNNITKIYLWGSYAANRKNASSTIKDLDVLLKTSLCPEDLLAVNNNILSKVDDINFLEEQGYNPQAVKLSNDLNNINKSFPICLDWWAMANNKLLHWGPILPTAKETDLISENAEKFAHTNTGKTKNEVKKQSEKCNWYKIYQSYLNDFFSDMPSGWYLSSEDNSEKILKNCIKRLPKEL